MNPSLLSFLLVLLVEGVSVLVNYLKDKLYKHMNRDNDGPAYAYDH